MQLDKILGETEHTDVGKAMDIEPVGKLIHKILFRLKIILQNTCSEKMNFNILIII